MELKTTIIRFDTPITQKEVPFFRSAIISTLKEADILFHNHSNDNGELRYSYPLIQYKRLDGKATIVAIGKGLEVVWDFFNGEEFNLRLGRRYINLQVNCIFNNSTDIITSNECMYKYKIVNWLPFNQDNYNKYFSTDIISEKVDILESILVGNILSMLKGCGITATTTIQAKITSISKPKSMEYKHVPLVSLDIDFQTNTPLPPMIGLGKHPSVGFGTIIPTV